MSINPALLNLVLSSETLSNKTISLNLGEIVRGSVQAIKADGTLLLMLKGKTIEATSEVPIKLGQQIFLQVYDVKDGKTLMRIMNPENIAQFNEGKLINNLINIGISPGKTELQMASKLLQFQLPVNSQNMSNMSKAISFLGEVTPKNIDIAAFSIARGLVINKENMNLMTNYSANRNIGDLVNRLTISLNQQTENTELNNNNRANTPEKAPTNSYQADSGNRTIRDNRQNNDVRIIYDNKSPVFENAKLNRAHGNILQTKEIILLNAGDNQQLRSIQPKNSGTFVNQMVNHALTAGDEGLTSSRNNQGLLNGKTELLFNKLNFTINSESRLLKHIKSEVDGLILKLEAATDTNAGQVKNLVDSRNASIQKLANMLQLLDNMENRIGSSKHAGMEDLSIRLNDVIRELASQQLMNTVPRGVPVDCNAIFFSLPLQVGANNEQVQIRINRDDKKKPWQDIENLSLAISLSTKKLGIVLFHIQWQKQDVLAIQGVVQNLESKVYLESKINELNGALQTLGMRVNDLGIKVVADAVQEDLRIKPNEEAAESVPWSLDIRV